MQIFPKRMSSYGRLGVLLMAMGAFLAMDTLLSEPVIFKLWPILLLLLGTGFVGIYRHRGRRETAYLASGLYALCFAVLALYCNFTSWGQLYWLWPLFIAFLGFGLCAGYVAGQRIPALLLTGLLLLAVAITFICVVTVGPMTWWTSLVGVGVSFIGFDLARRSS